MVKILAAVLTDGLPAVEAACLQALSEGVHSADVVNILARQRDPGPAATILTPDALRLRHAPTADCARRTAPFAKSCLPTPRRSSANWVVSNISRRNGPMGCGR
jgi:hypothetical protein